MSALSLSSAVHSSAAHSAGAEKSCVLSAEAWLEVAVEWTQLLAERALLWREQPSSLRRSASPGASREEFLRRDRQGREWGERLTVLEEELVGAEGPLALLATRLDLDAFDLRLLSLVVAVEWEPRLRSLLARLSGQTELNYLHRAGVAQLLGRSFAESSAVLRWSLVREEEVHPRDPKVLRVDPFFLSYLLGDSELEQQVPTRAVKPVQALPHWDVAGLIQKIEQSWDKAPVRVLLRGPRGVGRRSFAQCVARRLGLAVLLIDTQGMSEERFQEVYLRAQRQAWLKGHVLIWSADFLRRSAVDVPRHTPLQFILGEPGDVLSPCEGLVDREETVLPPGSSARAELWRRYVPRFTSWKEAEQARVVERYRVQAGDIVALAQRGVQTAEEASLGCRFLTRGRLDGLAELIDCPFVRADLVVAPAVNQALDDFLFEAQVRTVFWEREDARRLFPRGRGLVALLAGPPGTGKTMAAQVIAGELGLDLVRIDLASLVSKYIGETAKNLQRLFAQIVGMNAVLFFDEADALFAKRTEVKDSQDRHANADTNYLLQQLEEFEGIAVLSTNKKANIDPAFVRRLRYVLDFSLPRSSERLAIFESMIQQLVPEGQAALPPAVLPALAESFELSGAQIKLSVLGALFVAQRAGSSLTVEHLLVGIERELMKEGRYLVKTDRARVLERLRGRR